MLISWLCHYPGGNACTRFIVEAVLYFYELFEGADALESWVSMGHEDHGGYCGAGYMEEGIVRNLLAVYVPYICYPLIIPDITHYVQRVRKIVLSACIICASHLHQLTPCIFPSYLFNCGWSVQCNTS